MINCCPVYVINLDSAIERMQKIDAQLNAINVNYTRIQGIKGTELSDEQIADGYSSRLNRMYFRADLSLGEIGCYMSHRKVWQTMVNDNIDYAVILEDDLKVESNFIDIFKQEAVLKKYDLIKLAANRDYKATQISKLNDQFELINFNKIPNCANGYTLTLAGAKKLLTRKKFFRPVDIDMQFCSELELSVYGLRPYSISENPELTSDIVAINGGFHGKKTTNMIRNIKYRLHLWWLRKHYISGRF